MEQMINASLGLFETEDKFYLQIITSDEWNYYYCQISKEDAQLINKEEFLEIVKVSQLPGGTILEVPSNPPVPVSSSAPIKKTLKKGSPKKKFSNTEASFQKFLDTRRTCTVAEYLQLIKVDPSGASTFEGVEAVLLYHDHTPIFQLEEGAQWEADGGTATRRYVYQSSSDAIIENDQLEKVERKMFRDFLDNYL